ncbi:MAG: hypothetical protein RIS90_1856 [Pseudomonadota bacterium]
MRLAALTAPPRWRCIDLISDLHLQPGEPATVAAWQAYLQGTSADALFILGDLFEVWVGDDALAPGADGFAADCVALLRSASGHRPVYLLHGNRDFLLGEAFAQAAGLQLLTDPCVLTAGSQRWLLSHGDALCLADTDYQRFRTEVRSPAWQQAFLAQPLAVRQAQARALRAQSEARKRIAGADADLDAAACRAWLASHRADTLIHGHTHRPAAHDLGQGWTRLVLSDWDASAHPARAEVLRLHLPPIDHHEPARCERLAPSQAVA